MDKTEAHHTLAGLLDMNEPEALVSSVALMCERKTGDRFITEDERERWRNAAKALAGVISALERKSQPGDKAPAAA